MTATLHMDALLNKLLLFYTYSKLHYLEDR